MSRTGWLFVVIVVVIGPFLTIPHAQVPPPPVPPILPAPRGDTDGDGVVNLHDYCPTEGKFGTVNALGCPDSDLDGVSDRDDLCQGTPSGVPVDRYGCPAAIFAAPDATDPNTFGPDQARRLLSEMLRTRVQPRRCPDDNIGPPAPRILLPESRSAISTDFPRYLTIVWEAVSDPCGPVTYGIEIEKHWCKCDFTLARSYPDHCVPGSDFWTPVERKVGLRGQARPFASIVTTGFAIA